ncbi:hypothetical protein PmNV_013 [Penaeus monodon nudivirus]|uniref:Uncharacterized protein n=1 Tax=Penaeus monodon nudivirus TaxID=1529056 RepID=A0A076FIU9_9VIRU|nr:hypothetical protein PmNV_013 [Penaeus monodon nudivirus]AII15801.1 hypothetical protein PmNV_013 [Penaeus monodon nudivirus]
MMMMIISECIQKIPLLVVCSSLCFPSYPNRLPTLRGSSIGHWMVLELLSFLLVLQSMLLLVSILYLYYYIEVLL